MGPARAFRGGPRRVRLQGGRGARPERRSGARGRRGGLQRARDASPAVHQGRPCRVRACGAGADDGARAHGLRGGAPRRQPHRHAHKRRPRHRDARRLRTSARLHLRRQLRVLARRAPRAVWHGVRGHPAARLGGAPEPAPRRPGVPEGVRGRPARLGRPGAQGQPHRVFERLVERARALRRVRTRRHRLHGRRRDALSWVHRCAALPVDRRAGARPLGARARRRHRAGDNRGRRRRRARRQACLLGP